MIFQTYLSNCGIENSIKMTREFEGIVKGLSENQLKFISDLLDQHGVTDTKVKIEPVGLAGDNYGSDVRRIATQKDGKPYNIILKIKPKTDKNSGTDLIQTAFDNERVMYTEVFPKYTELEIKTNIPDSERVIFPICYGTLYEGSDAVIFMEDLKEKGFIALDRFKSFSNETVKKVLKVLASLHAYSFALKHNEPKTFEGIISKLTNPWIIMTQAEDFKAMFSNVEEDVLNVTENENHKSYLKNTVSRIGDILDEVLKVDKNSIYTVLTHGDAWSNNMMFTVKDGKVLSCCLIDYQVSRVQSPMMDVSWMIFNCTDHETRKNFHDWIDYYHAQLSKKLHYFGLNANVVYSKTQMNEDIKRCAMITFATALFASTVIVKQSREVAEVKETIDNVDFVDTMFESAKISNAKPETFKLFRARIKGLIDSYLELGLM